MGSRVLENLGVWLQVGVGSWGGESGVGKSGGLAPGRGGKLGWENGGKSWGVGELVGSWGGKSRVVGKSAGVSLRELELKWWKGGVEVHVLL